MRPPGPPATIVAVLLVLAGTLTAALAEPCAGTDLYARLGREEPAFVASIEAEAARMPHGSGRLFRLTRPGLAPSFVFATAHVTDPRVTSLSPAVRHALDDATTVALELVENTEEIAQALARDPKNYVSLVLARAEEKPDRFLSVEALARLERALPAFGLPGVAARTLRPSFLAVILSVPPCAAAEAARQPVLDQRLKELAVRSGKTVVGLETPVEQFAIFDTLSAEVQRELLLASIANIDRAEDIYEAILALYREARLGVLLTWARRSRGPLLAPLPAAFYEALIDARNARMAQRALPLTAKGAVLIAVGALHLPGEKGLLRLFENAGYTVEMVE
jgi:uncharacterized protein YbaP (TraB family)